MGLVDVTTMSLKPDPDQDTKFETLRKSGYKLYWVGVGKDDFLYKSVQTLRSSLDKHGLKYIYREVPEGIAGPTGVFTFQNLHHSFSDNTIEYLTSDHT